MDWKFIQDIAEDTVSTSKDWLKSHAVMAALVWLLLIAGLCIVNYGFVKFANFIGIFFIALGLAILDFLPIVGLFVPMGIWAVCAIFITQNVTLGIGVIIVCFAVSVIKQIIEPFVVGKTIGISALEEIISGLLGFLVFGFNPLGLIAGPIIYTVAKVTYKKIKKNNISDGNYRDIN